MEYFGAKVEESHKEFVHKIDKKPETHVDEEQEKSLPLKECSPPGYMTGMKYSSKSGVANQCLITLAVSLLLAGSGQPIGFSAVLLPQLYVENSTMKIDIEMGSWIAAVHSAATPLGSIICGPLMEMLGRRNALQVGALPMMLGWVIIAASSKHWIMLVGRAFCGISVGLTGAPSMVYLSEISEPRLRGTLSSAPIVSYSFGILLIYILGATMSWRVAAATSTILPLLSLLALSFAPESHVWLARKNKIGHSRKAIAFLRGGEQRAQWELEQILSATEVDIQDAKNLSFWETIRQKPVLKPILIVGVFYVMQALSGTFMIVFYAVDIISNATENNTNALLAANITATARLIFTIIASILLLKYGRRKILILSGAGSSLAIFSLAMYSTFIVDANIWITASLLLLYIVFNTTGFFILPSVLMGELLPAKVRGLCGGYILVGCHLFIFGFTKLYPFFRSTLGIYGMFYTFGISTITCTMIMYLFLPETKNRSLLQVEDYFKKPNYLWRNRNKDIII